MMAHVRLHLLIAAVLYLGCGLALLMGQEGAHRIISTGPYDTVTSAMFASALLAFAAMFLMGVLNPVKALVNASVVALAFPVLVAAYLMFISSSMPQHPATFFSLLIAFTIGAILFFSVIKSPVSSVTGSSVRATRRPQPSRQPRAKSRTEVARRAPVRKKSVKKQAKKKASLRRKRR